jgi:rhodanese-related sulfurtransferase
MGFFSNLFSSKPAVDYAELVKSGAIIVDVRTPGEFAQGHVKGAVNIPLDMIRSRAAELKQKNKPVITCCRSGARSGSAKSILTDAGIECYNGGAWDSLQNHL